jgi:RNA polymerase sigma-70 factor, ECF subfamily
MNTTSVSLLERLRQPGEPDAWRRFVHLYTPLLFHWARDVGLNDNDAADLVQDVLLLLMKKLPEFAYDPGRSFRGWLRTLTINKWREHHRRKSAPAAGEVADLPDPHADNAFAETEYREHLVSRALQLMQSEFETTTWKACWEFVVSGRPADEIARELGVSVAVVYSAKYRVLRRLRQELDGLLD